jgi:hypothetical protein
MELQNAALRFFGASLRRPEFSHPTSSDGRSPTRTSQGDFMPTTGGNLLIEDRRVRSKREVGIATTTTQQGDRIYHR